MTHNVWHICVFPVRNSPNNSVIELLSKPPPNKVSNSLEPDVILTNFLRSSRATELGFIPYFKISSTTFIILSIFASERPFIKTKFFFLFSFIF